MKTTKDERIKIVNEIILEISSRGRRFFQSNGKVAEIFIKNRKVYYKCEWVSEHNPVAEICLTTPYYRSPKGWFHGGTLLALVRDFQDYIRTGEHSNHNNGYGGLYCPHWGYSPDDMKAIQKKALKLGYLEEE